MPLISLTDPSTIRHFILHDVLLKTPIFEGYKTLCGIIGDENIDFPEYEFWYYRFYDGNFDLEDDRSSLPQPKTFMNLPIHVIREIPVHLDLKNRMNVRKVSKSLRDFIDSQKINFSEFYVNISKNSIHMRIEKDSFYYSEFPVEIPSQAVTIINKDFQKMASKDLENVLKIVRKIKILIVTVDECCSKIHFDSVVGKFRNFKYDVSDCRLHFLNTEDLTEFLSSMKPGKLEKLALSTTEGNGNSNELVEMDQFKMAKAVDIERFGILDPSLIDRFFGFAEFTVQLEDIRREDVISFRKALEKLPKNGEWNFHSTQLIREEVELAIDHLMVTNHNFSGGIRDGILWDFENYHGKPNSRNLGKIDNWKLCILSDVLAGKAIEKSYKDVAETFGAENIDFLDMELWFYRFYKGDYDLDYDRTLDGKHLEFSNLPMIIHQQIIDNLDSENHLTLRRISKSLRNMVDQGKPAIKHLSIEYKLHYIRVKIDNFSACYWKYLDVDYRKIALNHVLILLKNPKLRLRSLHVWSPCSLDPFFIDFFNNLKHKISTKYLELNVDCPEATSLFLTCMKPKFLEEVILMKGSIAEIVKFDQWKSLKNALCSPIVSGQIDHFLGFTKCVITVPDLTEEHLMKLREELSKSQIFESCHIFLGNFEVPYELIMSVFEPISGLEYVYDEDDMPQFVYSYVIPNSRNFLNWTISMDDTVIKEEVIEEEFNFTFKNYGFVEVKQEEFEQKPEYLLEKDLEINSSKLFGADEPDDEFFEAVKLKKVSITGTTKLECGICQKMMPKNLLKLFKSEENKTVLAEIFKIERLIDPKRIFVCVSHIQKIIDDYDGKLKRPSTPFEHLLRSFIRQNKKLMKDKTSSRADCKIGVFLEQKIRNEPIDFFGNNNSDEFFDDIEMEPGECASEIEKEMNEAVVKEEAIDEEYDFAYNDEEFVGVKKK